MSGKTTPTPTPAENVAQSDGIQKVVSVYAVKAGTHSVFYPTKARASDAQKTLDKFGIASTIEAVKKTVTI